MGKPAFEHPLQLLFPNGPMIEAPIIIDGETIRATFVCMGNPHCVVFINRFSDINLEQLGKKLEHHPCFPELANVNFVICTADGNLQMQTWERGAGHTQACGTGACAATVAAMLTKRIPFGQIKVFMEGGEMLAVMKRLIDDSAKAISSMLTCLFLIRFSCALTVSRFI